jgi:hypothetical protein
VSAGQYGGLRHVGAPQIARAEALLAESRSDAAALEQVALEQAERQRLYVRRLELLVSAIRYEVDHTHRTDADVRAAVRRLLSAHASSGSSTPALWCSPDGPEDEGVTGPALPLSGVSPDAQRQGTPDRPGWMGHNHDLVHYDRLGISEVQSGTGWYGRGGVL